eukprot:2478373-Prymnesium_polylepis.1
MVAGHQAKKSESWVSPVRRRRRVSSTDPQGTRGAAARACELAACVDDCSGRGECMQACAAARRGGRGPRATSSSASLG